MNNKEKIILSALSIWSLIHTYLFILSKDAPLFRQISIKDSIEITNRTSEFYPFTYFESTLSPYHLEKVEFIPYFDVAYYDLTEFFVYVIVPWVLFVLWRSFQTKT